MSVLIKNPLIIGGSGGGESRILDNKNITYTYNGEFTEKAEYQGYDAYRSVTVNTQVNLNVGNKWITNNGTYTAQDDGLTGYSILMVNVEPEGVGSKEISTISSDGTYTYRASDDDLVGYGYISGTVSIPESLSKDPNSNDVYYCCGTQKKLLSLDPTKTTLTIDQNTTSIGPYACCGCSNLTNSITIPSSVTTIDKYAFFECDNITNLTIPATVTYIDESAFAHCINLETVTFLGETFVEDGAFSNCDKLETVTFAEGVTRCFGDGAFYGVDNLQSIYLPSTITEFKDSLFWGLNDKEINVYYNGTLEDWLNIRMDGQSSNPTRYLHNIIFNDGTDLTGAITIPSNISTINQYAFIGCSGITSIDFNNTQIIKTYAFQECPGLNSVQFSDTTRTIESYAFAQSGVVNISFPNSDQTSIAVGSYAFQDCPIVSVTIPSGIHLSSYTFNRCNRLTTITVYPNTSIPYSLFYGSDNVSEIYFMGDLSQWLDYGSRSNLLALTGQAYYNLYLNGQKLEGAITIENNSLYYGFPKVANIQVLQSLIIQMV